MSAFDPTPIARIALTLSAREHAELQQLARASDRSMAAEARRAIKAHLQAAKPPAAA